MRRFLSLLPLILAGWGSDGIDYEAVQQLEPHVPRVSSLSLSPDTAIYMEGDGSVSVTAQFDYFDRGAEMADHQKFSLATNIKVCFCDPQHPWRRRSNENTNGLLRQYFPKGIGLSNVHQNRLNAVARRFYERPR